MQPYQKEQNKRVTYQQQQLNKNWSPTHPSSPNTNNLSSTKLFVGGIPFNSTEHELEHYFSKFGAVSSIELARHPKSKKLKGFALVNFKSQSSAEAALKISEHIFMRKKMGVRKAKNPDQAKKQQQQQQQLKLYISGLNMDATEQELETIFTRFGKVDRVMLQRNSKTGEARGFAYVIMKDHIGYKKAINKRNIFFEKNNETILIEPAKSKEEMIESRLALKKNPKETQNTDFLYKEEKNNLVTYKRVFSKKLEIFSLKVSENLTSIHIGKMPRGNHNILLKKMSDRFWSDLTEDANLKSESYSFKCTKNFGKNDSKVWYFKHKKFEKEEDFNLKVSFYVMV